MGGCIGKKSSKYFKHNQRQLDVMQAAQLEVQGYS